MEGAYRGPLLVLVDHRTISAAEGFAALLQDNSAAFVMGEATFGAGCGYTDGGIPFTLAHSGGEVKMPDCVRIRRDGGNEVEGVAPDRLIAWRRADSPLQRAQRLLEALERDALRLSSSASPR